MDGFQHTTAHPKCKPRKVYDNFNDACDAYIKRYEDRVKKQTNLGSGLPRYWKSKRTLCVKSAA